MKKLDFKKIKNWTKKHKGKLTIVGYGAVMLVSGVVIGYVTGYKKWGSIIVDGDLLGRLSEMDVLLKYKGAK